MVTGLKEDVSRAAGVDLTNIPDYLQTTERTTTPQTSELVSDK